MSGSKARYLAELAQREDELVAKGGRTFALVGGLTGAGGAAGTAYEAGHGNKDRAKDAAALTVGGWSGQGAYQGAGYGAKWRAQAKHEPQVSRAKRDKTLKAAKKEHGAYTPQMERNYPKTLPEWRTHRVLGYTHRGKLGTALGATATAAGAVGALRASRSSVKKSLVLKAYEPLKTSVSDKDAKRLVGRHGLTGPLPKTLDRNQRMAAYEARYVTAGGKKAEKYSRRARVGDRMKNVGLAGATVGSALWTAGRVPGLRTAAKPALKLLSHPKVSHHAETAVGASAALGGAGELYAGHARKKRSSYASAPAGVAASALRRMQAYPHQ